MAENESEAIFFFKRDWVHMIRRNGATRKHKRNYFDESLRIDDGLAEMRKKDTHNEEMSRICTRIEFFGQR